MIDEREALAAARSWVDAWNGRDLEGVLEPYADDVEFSSPTVITRLGEPSGWIHGKSRLREHFQAGMASPVLRFDLVSV